MTVGTALELGELKKLDVLRLRQGLGSCTYDFLVVYPGPQPRCLAGSAEEKGRIKLLELRGFQTWEGDELPGFQPGRGQMIVKEVGAADGEWPILYFENATLSLTRNFAHGFCYPHQDS